MEDWKGGRRKAPVGRQVEEWKGGIGKDGKTVECYRARYSLACWSVASKGGGARQHGRGETAASGQCLVISKGGGELSESGITRIVVAPLDRS